MSFSTLPQEVLEILFMYLDIEDLLTVWKVVDFEGSDFFWKKLCKREGYKNTLIEGRSWKRVFYRNINWITQRFVKREFRFDKPRVKVKYSDDTRPILVHGEVLAIQSSEHVVSFWNIGLHKQPVLIQELPSDDLIVSGTKLGLFSLDQGKRILKVYSFNHNYYSECFSMESYSMICRPSNYCSITDEYVAVYDFQLEITVFDFKTCEDFTLPIESDLIYIVLGGHVLYVMVFEDSGIVMRRYNLKERVWLDDIILSQGVDILFELEVSADILVNWVKFDDSVTPIKVWKSNGEFLKSLTYEFIISFGIQAKPVLWLIVEGEYVIFSIDETNITIWCSEYPDIIKQMEINDTFYFNQKVISSNLLVLPYKSYFKVVDFKKATYLYDVQLDNNHGSTQEYLVNEYFFLHLKGVGEVYEEATLIEDTQGNLVKISFRPFIPCILTIYDFRSEEIEN